MRRAEHHDDGPLFGARDVDRHAETVDGDHGGRHLATLQERSPGAGRFSRRADAVRQADRARSACLAVISRNVCGSEPLTGMDGFGCRERDAEHRHRRPMFSNEK